MRQGTAPDPVSSDRLTIHSQPRHAHNTELEIVSALNEAVSEFQADVLFGSYPFYGEAAGPRVIITLECPDEGRVDAAKDFFLARVKPAWVIKVANDDELEKAEVAAAAGARKE